MTVLFRDQPQLRPVPFRLEDRRLPLPRQLLEGAGAEQRVVKFASLLATQLR